MFWRLTYKHIRKLLVIIMSIIFTIIRTTAFCDWVQVGESLNVNIDKQVRCPRIDVSNGTPYVTWWECRSAGIEENYLYVKYYNGSSWIQAGGILNINANNIEFANSTSIAITEGTPYVAWNEKVGTGKMQIYVKHYDGNSWIQDGGSLNIDENQCAVFPDIAINDNGTPYVTWQEELDSVFNIYVKYYISNKWVQAGGSLNMSQSSYYPSITCNNAKVYVAWKESSQIFVKKYSGSSWYQIGGSLNVNPSKEACYPSIAVGIDNEMPYVTWMENEFSSIMGGQINLKHCVGGNWVYYGNLNVNPENIANDPYIAIGNNNIPYVTWRERSGSHSEQIYVKHYIEGMWIQDGGSLNVASMKAAGDPSISIYNNIPYVCWTEKNISDVRRKIYVKYFEPTPTPVGDVYVHSIAPQYSLPFKKVNVTIRGDNFEAPIAVKLSQIGNTDIIASDVVIENVKRITCDFNLNMVLPGIYDINVAKNENCGCLTRGFLITKQIEPPVQWSIADVGKAEAPSITGVSRGIYIGDGDKDGLNEIFAAGLIQRLLKYDRIGEIWSISPLPIEEVGHCTSVIVCDGDNDRQVEVYGAAIGQAGNYVYEFSGPNWEKKVLGTFVNEINCLSYGDGNNDGNIEIYAACADGNIYEFKKEEKWLPPISCGNGKSEMHAVALGDGNNDGAIEIYAASEDKNVYQFKYITGSWRDRIVGTGEKGMNAVALGDGDQDGDIEVYATNQDGKLYKFEWTEDFYWKTEVINSAINGCGLAIGDGDNNGENEIYCVSSDRHVYQIQNKNNQWIKNDLGSAPHPLYNLVVGDGNNDYESEIYVIASDSHVYQFKASSAPTPTHTPMIGFEGLIISRKYIYAAPNPIRGKFANIVIHTRQPAEINVKIFSVTHKEVLSFRKYYNSIGEHTEQIHIGNLANGVYLLFVEAKGGNGVEEKALAKIAIIK